MEGWNASDGDSYVSKYKVMGKIGHGAFSEVFRGIDLETDRQVALKLLFHRATGAQPKESPDASREINALQALSDNNIVELLDVIHQDSGHVLVMELCVTDLSEVLRQARQRLDDALVKGLMLQILKGVAACHRAGYLHGDLKPGNVLLAANGTLKLADLGLACLCPGHEGIARTSAAHAPALATRWYRAPELLLCARTCGQAVDMWATGCILAELLGLCPLFPGESDMDQLSRIAGILGSVDLQTWPEAKSLPDYGKVYFDKSPIVPLPNVLPDAHPLALDLLHRLLQWNPGSRLRASFALQHDYFRIEPLPLSEAEISNITGQILRGRGK